MKPPFQEATLGAPRTCAQGHAWSCVFGVQIEPKDSLSTGPALRGIRKGTLSTDVWPRESPDVPGRPIWARSLTFARSPLLLSVSVRLKRIKKLSCCKSNMHYTSNMRFCVPTCAISISPAVSNMRYRMWLACLLAI